MEFNKIFMKLVRATITVHDLQVLGGWLAGNLEEKDFEFAKNFVGQAVFQMRQAGLSPYGDKDMHKSLDFEIPIGHVSYITEIIKVAAEKEKVHLGLVPLWAPFMRVTRGVYTDIANGIRADKGRHYDDLGPERLN